MGTVSGPADSLSSTTSALRSHSADTGLTRAGEWQTSRKSSKRRPQTVFRHGPQRLLAQASPGAAPSLLDGASQQKQFEMPRTVPNHVLEGVLRREHAVGSPTLVSTPVRLRRRPQHAVGLTDTSHDAVPLSPLLGSLPSAMSLSKGKGASPQLAINYASRQSAVNRHLRDAPFPIDRGRRIEPGISVFQAPGTAVEVERGVAVKPSLSHVISSQQPIPAPDADRACAGHFRRESTSRSVAVPAARSFDRLRAVSPSQRGRQSMTRMPLPTMYTGGRGITSPLQQHRTPADLDQMLVRELPPVKGADGTLTRVAATIGAGSTPVAGRLSMRHEQDQRVNRVVAEQSSLRVPVREAVASLQAVAATAGASVISGLRRDHSLSSSKSESRGDDFPSDADPNAELPRPGIPFAASTLRTGCRGLDAQLAAAAGRRMREFGICVDTHLQRAIPQSWSRSLPPHQAPAFTAAETSGPGRSDGSGSRGLPVAPAVTGVTAATGTVLDTAAQAVGGAQVLLARSDMALSEVETEVASLNIALSVASREARAGVAAAGEAFLGITSALVASVVTLDGRLQATRMALQVAKASRAEVEAGVESSLRGELERTLKSWQERLLREESKVLLAEEASTMLHRALNALQDAVKEESPVNAGKLLLKAQAAREDASEARDEAKLAHSRTLELQTRLDGACVEIEALRQKLQEQAATIVASQREAADARAEAAQALRTVEGARAAQRAAEKRCEDLMTESAPAVAQPRALDGTASQSADIAASSSARGFETDIAIPPETRKPEIRSSAPIPAVVPFVHVHRVPCAAFRSLLPALGTLPRPPMPRPRVWVCWCFRAMLCAKAKADQLAWQRGESVQRWPDFAYSWFDDASSLEAASAAGLGSELPPAALTRDSKEVARSDGVLTVADLRRWAYYYGVRAWAFASPEGRLALLLLDETAGADGARFAVFVAQELRAGDGEHEPAILGPSAAACDYSRMPVVIEIGDAESKLEESSRRTREESHRRQRRPFEPLDCTLLDIHPTAVIAAGASEPNAAGASGSESHLTIDCDLSDAEAEGDADAAQRLWHQSGLSKLAGWRVVEDSDPGGGENAGRELGAALSSAGRQGIWSRSDRRGKMPARLALDEDDSDTEDVFVNPDAALRAAATMIRLGSAAPASLRAACTTLNSDSSVHARLTVRWLRRAGAGTAAVMRAGLLPDFARAAAAASAGSGSGDAGAAGMRAAAESAALAIRKRRAARALRRSTRLLPPRRVWLPLRSALAAVCRCLRYADADRRSETIAAVACMARPAQGRLPSELVLASGSGSRQPASSQLQGEGGHEGVLTLLQADSRWAGDGVAAATPASAAATRSGSRHDPPASSTASSGAASALFGNASDKRTATGSSSAAPGKAAVERRRQAGESRAPSRQAQRHMRRLQASPAMQALRASASAVASGPARGGSRRDAFCVDLFEVVAVLMGVLQQEQTRRSEAVEQFLQAIVRSRLPSKTVPGDAIVSLANQGDGSMNNIVADDAAGVTLAVGAESKVAVVDQLEFEIREILRPRKQMATAPPQNGWWAAKVPPPWTPLLEALRPDIDLSGQLAKAPGAGRGHPACLDRGSGAGMGCREGMDSGAHEASWPEAGDIDLSDPSLASRLLNVLAPGLPATTGASIRRAAAERAATGTTSALDLLRSVEERGVMASAWALRLPLPLVCGESSGVDLLRAALSGTVADSSAVVAAQSIAAAHQADVMQAVRRGFSAAAGDSSGGLLGGFDASLSEGGGWVQSEPAAFGIASGGAAAQAGKDLLVPAVPLRPSWAWSRLECAMAADVVNARMAALERDLAPWLGPVASPLTRRVADCLPVTAAASVEAEAGLLPSQWADVATAAGEIAAAAHASVLSDAGAVVGGLRGSSNTEKGHQGESGGAVWSLPLVDRVWVSRIQRARFLVHKGLDEAIGGDDCQAPTDGPAPQARSGFAVAPADSSGGGSSSSHERDARCSSGMLAGPTQDGRQAMRAYLFLLRELCALRSEVLSTSGLVGAAWHSDGLGAVVSAASLEMDALEGILRRDAPSLALLQAGATSISEASAASAAGRTRSFSIVSALQTASAVGAMASSSVVPWHMVAAGRVHANHSSALAAGLVRALPSPCLPLPPSRRLALVARAGRSWESAGLAYRGSVSATAAAASVPGWFTSRASRAMARARMMLAALRVQRSWRASRGGWSFGTGVRRASARFGPLRCVLPALGVPRRAAMLAPAAAALAAAAHAELPVILGQVGGSSRGSGGDVQGHTAGGGWTVPEASAGAAFIAAGVTAGRALAACGWLCCPAPGDGMTHALATRATLWATGKLPRSGRHARLGVDPASDDASRSCAPVIGRRLRAVCAALMSTYAASTHDRTRGSPSDFDEEPVVLAELRRFAVRVLGDAEAAACAVWGVCDGLVRQGGARGAYRKQTAVLDSALTQEALVVDDDGAAPVAEDPAAMRPGSALSTRGQQGFSTGGGATTGNERHTCAGAGVEGVQAEAAEDDPDTEEEDRADRASHASHAAQAQRGTVRAADAVESEDGDAYDEAEMVGSAGLARAVGASMGISASLLGGRRWGVLVPGLDRLPKQVRGVLKAAGCDQGPRRAQPLRCTTWKLPAAHVFHRHRKGRLPSAAEQARMQLLASIFSSRQGAAVLVSAAALVASLSPVAAEKAMAKAIRTPEGAHDGAGSAGPTMAALSVQAADLSVLADPSLVRVGLADAITSLEQFASALLPQTAATLAWRVLSPPEGVGSEVGGGEDDCWAAVSSSKPSSSGMTWLFSADTSKSVPVEAVVDGGWLVWCMVRAWAEDSAARLLACRAHLLCSVAAAGGGSVGVSAQVLGKALQCAWPTGRPPWLRTAADSTNGTGSGPATADHGPGRDAATRLGLFESAAHDPGLEGQANRVAGSHSALGANHALASPPVAAWIRADLHTEASEAVQDAEMCARQHCAGFAGAARPWRDGPWGGVWPAGTAADPSESVLVPAAATAALFRAAADQSMDGGEQASEASGQVPSTVPSAAGGDESDSDEEEVEVPELPAAANAEGGRADGDLDSSGARRQQGSPQGDAQHGSAAVGAGVSASHVTVGDESLASSVATARAHLLGLTRRALPAISAVAAAAAKSGSDVTSWSPDGAAGNPSPDGLMGVRAAACALQRAFHRGWLSLPPSCLLSPDAKALESSWAPVAEAASTSVPPIVSHGCLKRQKAAASLLVAFASPSPDASVSTTTSHAPSSHTGFRTGNVAQAAANRGKGGGLTLRCACLASAAVVQAFWRQHGERASDDAGQGELTAPDEASSDAAQVGEDPEAAWRRRRALQQDVQAAVRLGASLEKLTSAEDAMLSAWESADCGMAGAVADEEGLEENEPDHAEALMARLQELEAEASTAASSAPAADDFEPAWATRLDSVLRFRDDGSTALELWRAFRVSGAFLRLRGRPGIVEMTS